MKSLSLCAVAAVLFASSMTMPTALAQTATSGAFRNLSEIETSLKGGLTGKAEVRRLLGIPNGSGASRFSVLGGDERQIWYYEDFEMTGARSADPVMKIEMRQQMLLVFFKGEVVDGYLWTSNAGTGSAR